MPPAANPFDDDYEAPELQPATTTTPPRQRPVTNNPFDDVDDDNNYDVHHHQPAPPVPIVSSSPYVNPFDDDNFNSNNHNSTKKNTAAMMITMDDNNDKDDDDDEDDPLMDGDAPAEASWQYLGDLPYRRVPVYSNVRWNSSQQPPPHSAGEDSASFNKYNSNMLNFGLASVPAEAMHHPDMLDPREVRALLHTTTVTKVAACPHGGPVAAITVPIVSTHDTNKTFPIAQLRIMTNAGKPLATLPFPPQKYRHRNYAPSDVLTIGFTDRYILIVVLRDSLCFTYFLNGEPVLQPFTILPRSGDGNKPTELLQANVFDGGVSVLSTTKHAAMVELLDDHDDPDYYNQAHLAARKILPTNTSSSSTTNAAMETAFGGQVPVIPPHYAIVTHLPTAAHARYVIKSCRNKNTLICLKN